METIPWAVNLCDNTHFWLIICSYMNSSRTIEFLQSHFNRQLVFSRPNNRTQVYDAYALALATEQENDSFHISITQIVGRELGAHWQLHLFSNLRNVLCGCQSQFEYVNRQYLQSISHMRDRRPFNVLFVRHCYRHCRRRLDWFSPPSRLLWNAFDGLVNSSSFSRLNVSWVVILNEEWNNKFDEISVWS